MEWLNYHHLLYFWVVAKEGSVSAAARELRLAPPTISGQVHRLEEILGEKLFDHKGRQLLFTETGRIAFDSAQDNFAQGKEFQHAKRARAPGSPLKLAIGFSEVLSETVVHRLLKPAFSLKRGVQIVCREARSTAAFLEELALRAIDVVLTDTPAPASAEPRLFNHFLGECGTSFFATDSMAKALRRRFPDSLDGAPFLLPGKNATLRQTLERWFEELQVRPTVVAEAEDGSLMNALGEAGLGVFVSPDVVERDVRLRHDVTGVGRVPQLRQRFFAVSAERKIKHPAVATICETSRTQLFA